jgi:hypothetical protein
METVSRDIPFNTAYEITSLMMQFFFIFILIIFFLGTSYATYFINVLSTRYDIIFSYLLHSG